MLGASRGSKLLIYEIISYVALGAAIIWAVHARDPLGFGAVFGGTLLFGFDWFWCGLSFFNATFSPDLATIPGLHIRGQTYPIAVACNWGVGFGLVPFLASRRHAAWRAHLGIWHVPVVFIVSGAIDLILEMTLVTGLGVYTYHQAPKWLLDGVPWSNFWFGGALLTLSYLSLSYARQWSGPSDRDHIGAVEGVCKGMVFASAALWSSFYVSTLAQLFWYSAVGPWMNSGRAF